MGWEHMETVETRSGRRLGWDWTETVATCWEQERTIAILAPHLGKKGWERKETVATADRSERRKTGTTAAGHQLDQVETGTTAAGHLPGPRPRIHGRPVATARRPRQRFLPPT